MRTGSQLPSPSGQDEGPRCVAGLQAAQELPGFLLHEELVLSPPTGHCLPGAGPLGEGKKVTNQAGAACSQGTPVSLVGGAGDISMTLPLDASLPVLSPPSCWPWGCHSHLWAPGPQDMATPLCGTRLQVRKNYRLVKRRGSRMQMFTQGQPGQAPPSRTGTY